MFVGKDEFPFIYLGQKMLKARNISGLRTNIIPVQPSVRVGPNFYLDIGYRIVGVEKTQERGIFWTARSSVDIIAAWRALKILELIPSILPSGEIAGVYAAAQREPSEHLMIEAHVVIQTLDKNAYERIMTSIPPKLDEALSIFIEHCIGIDILPLIDEVRLGVLPITPQLEKLGIENPAISEQRGKRAQELIEPYWKFVIPYLKSEGCTEDSRLAHEIRSYLLECLVRGINETDLIVGTAIVAAHHAISGLFFGAIAHVSPIQEYLQNRLREQVERVARYLVRQFQGKNALLLKTSALVPTPRKKADYTRLIFGIKEGWGTMPQVLKI